MAADALTAAPFHAFDCFVFGSLIYFMCGLTLSDGGGHYFVFLLIAISYAICMGSVTRCVAYAMPSAPAASAVCVLFVVVSVFFSGGIATYDVI